MSNLEDRLTNLERQFAHVVANQEKIMEQFKEYFQMAIDRSKK